MGAPKLVVMGRIVAPFGVKGWVKVASFAEAPESLREFSSWWIGAGENWREHKVAESARQGAMLLARLEGCEDRDAAARLRGREVAVPRAALRASGEGEFYQADLIGLEVRNLQGERLGSVAEFVATGAHPVMRLAGEDRERLLPFVAAVVKMVDTGAGCILVDWGKSW